MRSTGRVALVSGLAMAPLALPAATFAAPYPPPSEPTTSTSASEVAAGDPVTICAEHYAADATVQLTDDGKHVTAFRTDSDGKGCVTVVWSSPSATAHRTGQAAALRATDAGAIRLVAFRSPDGTVCHAMTNTGPDAAGSTATTTTRVCVEPGSESGSTGGGGHVEGVSSDGSQGSHGRLAFTGTAIAAMVTAALALLAFGVAALRAGRRRRLG